MPQSYDRDRLIVVDIPNDKPGSRDPCFKQVVFWDVSTCSRVVAERVAEQRVHTVVQFRGCVGISLEQIVDLMIEGHLCLGSEAGPSHFFAAAMRAAVV